MSWPVRLAYGTTKQSRLTAPVVESTLIWDRVVKSLHNALVCLWRLVTEDSGKLPRNVPECFMHVGIADATCAHPHQYLTRSGLRLRNISDLSRTAHGRYYGRFYIPSSYWARRFAPKLSVEFVFPKR